MTPATLARIWRTHFVRLAADLRRRGLARPIVLRGYRMLLRPRAALQVRAINDNSPSSRCLRGEPA